MGIAGANTADSREWAETIGATKPIGLLALLSQWCEQHKAPLDWRICTSQTHTTERNHQVSMVAHIYHNCLCAIIWLVEESEQFAVEFEALGYSDNLIGNEFFSRLWIVQEIVLSSDQKMLCGKTLVDPKILGTTMYQMFQWRSRSGTVVSYLLRTGYKGEFELNTADENCEDPRDKVYGLMSIVKANERVVVDHNKTLEVTLADTVMVLKDINEYRLMLKFSEQLALVGLGEH
jgi:hypothetical protein